MLHKETRGYKWKNENKSNNVLGQLLSFEVLSLKNEPWHEAQTENKQHTMVSMMRSRDHRKRPKWQSKENAKKCTECHSMWTSMSIQRSLAHWRPSNANPLLALGLALALAFSNKSTTRWEWESMDPEQHMCEMSNLPSSSFSPFLYMKLEQSIKDSLRHRKRKRRRRRKKRKRVENIEHVIGFSFIQFCKWEASTNALRAHLQEKVAS